FFHVGDGDGKGAAFARLAVEVDFATHHQHQLFHDCQPQACAAILTGSGVVYLTELVENHILRVGGDADAGIRNRDLPTLGIVLTEVDLHGTLFREFDCIGNQVDDDLFEPRRIADDGFGKLWVDVYREFKP